MKGDTKFIALDRARTTLHLLKKSNIEGRDSLIRQLTGLQHSLRYSTNEPFDPSIILEPFLSLLKAPYLAGPFKQAALDSIQMLLNTDVFVEFPLQSGELLTNIVHAITRCKFIQTDATGDELVQLNIIQTLNIVVKSSSNRYLTGDTTWDIVETCQNILLQAVAVGSVRSPALCSSAERTLLDTIRLVFTGSINHDDESNEFESASKILAYFVGVLDKYSAEVSNSQRAGAGAGNNNNSRRSMSRSNPPLDNASLDADTTELLLALRAINVMMLASRSTISSSHSILRSARIVGLIRDDLSRCIVMLSGRRDFVPLVLQAILSLFGTLFTLYGPFLRVMVSCFVPSVYLKALHQLSTHFAKQYDTILRPMVADFEQHAQALPREPTTPGNPAASPVNFNLDEMEMILESLGDLLSDPGVIPTLFASFDSDPASADVVQPMIRYLCVCCRYSIIMEGQRVGLSSLQLYEHCIHLLRHVLKTLFIRINDRVPRDHPNARSFATTSTSVAVDRDHLNNSSSAENSVSLDQVSATIHAFRASKGILSEAARLFIVKPQKGLMFLQQAGVLTTPLNPATVAKFLRIARDLPKDVVGAFLGELGKDDYTFEADSKQFHQQVLRHYVESFALDDQSVLNCMRIFLSAFRLPGEAQQIDRILVAFSEFCHCKCLEGRSGLLENAEVTYLLTFSIIMLNTDRHNPNIKAERKMTVDQFVRNNLNYGRDCHQTYPLPTAFLEAIYASIAEYPIRTEGNDILSDITPEEWLDLQLQAAENCSRACLLTACHSTHHVNALATYVRSQNIAADAHNAKSIVASYSTCTPSQAAALHLTSENAVDSMELSVLVNGSFGIVDADLASVIWQDLLAVCVCPFLVEKNNNRHASQSSSYTGQRFPELSDEETLHLSSYIGVSAGPLGLQLAADIMAVVSLIADFVRQPDVVDAVLFLLAEFAGLLKGSVVHEIFSSMPSSLYFEKFGIVLSSMASSSSLKSLPMSPQKLPALPSTPSWSINSASTGGALLEMLINSAAARVAVVTLLRLVSAFQCSVSTAGWNVVWRSLALLRDCVLLPVALVTELDPDLLPDPVRREFDARVKSVRDGAAQARQSVADRKRTKSYLSLQALGEALFGSSEEHPEPVQTQRTWRWDEGYEEILSVTPPSSARAAANDEALHNASTTNNNNSISFNLRHPNVLIAEFVIPNAALQPLLPPDKDLHGTPAREYIEQTFRVLRQLVTDTGVARLVNDSRFLNQISLLSCLAALTQSAESVDREQSAGNGNGSSKLKKPERAVSGGADEGVRSELNGRLVECVGHSLPRVSEPSAAWLEMVLVDIALRNRDRFQSYWPLLDSHYRHTLNSSATLSYVTERRLLGVFKIASRLLSRDGHAEPLLQLISATLSAPDSVVSSADSLQSWVDVDSDAKQNISTNSVDTSNSSSKLRKTVINDLANQISGGLWQLLTQNVVGLPSLRLEQWQTLFDLLAQVGSAGDYASVRAFEAMAWLLHEPRLRAEVPVFCIVALKPLLLNPLAPLSVSLGAVQLLSHLHTRLEVLIKDESDSHNADSKKEVKDENDSLGADGSHGDIEHVDDDDAPFIWEASWVPILQVLAEGSADGRLEVRGAAVSALSRAVQDRHSNVVPAGVLIRVLGDVVIPVVQFLGETLVQATIAEQQELPKKIQLILHQQELTQKQSQRPPKPVWKTTGTSTSLVTPLQPPTPQQQTVAPLMVVHQRVAFLEEAMQGMCTAFVKQLPRLIRYPSFDKLWFRFLHVFGYFLGASHSFEASLLQPLQQDPSIGTPIPCPRQQELQGAVSLACDNTKRLLDCLVRTRVFKRRPELWVVTVDIVSQFVFTPGLIESNADSSTPSTPFSPASSVPPNEEVCPNDAVDARSPTPADSDVPDNTSNAQEAVNA